MLITDQVAIAPCSDCVQARRLTFKAESSRIGERSVSDLSF